MEKFLRNKNIRTAHALFFLLILNGGIIFAFNAQQDPVEWPGNKKLGSNKIFSITLKGAYFEPSRKAFKEIYKNRMLLEGEFNLKVYKFVKLWLAGNYYCSRGNLPFSAEDTKISLMGIGGGIKLQTLMGTFSPYLGFGPLVYFYKENNSLGIAQGTDLGFIAQTGCHLFIFQGIFLDLFVSYTKCKVQPQVIEADIGGLYGGISLGVIF